jgi:hypothetical protein
MAGSDKCLLESECLPFEEYMAFAERIRSFDPQAHCIYYTYSTSPTYLLHLLDLLQITPIH